MTVDVNIFLVKDSFGNEAGATSEEFCDTVQLVGLKDNEGNRLYYEDDGKHLMSWCKDNDLQYKHTTKEFDFGQLWNEI